METELVSVIDEELTIEQQERSILEKRSLEADKVMPTVTSKAMQQDLETEKARIGQRLSDLATRHDFLSKEKERFSIKWSAGTHDEKYAMGGSFGFSGGDGV